MNKAANICYKCYSQYKGNEEMTHVPGMSSSGTPWVNVYVTCKTCGWITGYTLSSPYPVLCYNVDTKEERAI